MTTEGWIGVMYDAIDITKIDRVPKKDNHPFNALFFFIYMLFGNLFILNMFVGVTINVFNQEKETLHLNHLLTPLQLDWCEVCVMIYKQKPLSKYQLTGNKFKDFSYTVVSNAMFD